jgi:hypothetical protein
MQIQDLKRSCTGFGSKSSSAGATSPGWSSLPSTGHWRVYRRPLMTHIYQASSLELYPEPISAPIFLLPRSPRIAKAYLWSSIIYR